MKTIISGTIKRWLIVLCSIGVIAGCGSDGGSNQRVVSDPPPPPPPTFLQRLEQIEGVQAEQRPSPVDGYQYYFFTVQQHTNPNDSSSPIFSQRARLLLRDDSAPIVLLTRGYALRNEQSLQIEEVAGLLDANQLEVEHRYFGESMPQAASPQDVPWETMTIENAATDHHRIVEKVSTLLSGKWIATGRSKGGMTATYLKRFYPDDLAGVIGFVAPLSMSMWDERFADYSVSVLDTQCREKFQTYQRQALLRLDELTPMVEAYATENNLTVNSNGYDLRQRLQAEVALSWISIGSYYENMLCEHLPTPDDDTEAYLEFIYQSSYFEFIADEGLLGWLPYHMQSALELGNFSAPLSHIDDLLSFDVKDFAINLIGLEQPEFKPEVMQDIYDWSQNEASQLIMIYGEQDIFTGGAYPLVTDETRDVQLHIEPGLHGIKISDLSDEAQQQIVDALTRLMSP